MFGGAIGAEADGGIGLGVEASGSEAKDPMAGFLQHIGGIMEKRGRSREWRAESKFSSLSNKLAKPLGEVLEL